MADNPEYEFDRHEKAIYVKHEGEKTKLYPDATRKEFAVISDIEDLVTEASELSHKLILTIQHRESLIKQSDFFSSLNSFQNEAGDCYEQCARFQSVARETSSEIVGAHLQLLFKLEKFLKHYFRQLSVAQSLGFSEQLIFSYLRSQNHVFLYGAVRNACSTLEYLGKLVENRLGDGVLDSDDKGLNFKDVYKELQQQEIDETVEDSQEVLIPPQNDRMEMGELALEYQEMDFIWAKRNDIVHNCPLVVERETVEKIPDEIVTAATISHSEIKRLTRLSSRIHLHSIGMFLNYSKSYQIELVEKFVEAIFQQDSNEP